MIFCYLVLREINHTNAWLVYSTILRDMAKSKGSSTFYSLQKYTRSRQLVGKSGFCLAINSDGDVTATSDQNSPYGEFQACCRVFWNPELHSRLPVVFL